METTQYPHLGRKKLEQPAEKTVDVALPNPQQEGEESVLDRSALEGIYEMGGEEGDFVAAQIIQMYLDTTPPYLQQIEAAIATGNTNALRQAAHSLGSSSAALGAINLAKYCKELENLARSDIIPPNESQFNLLQSEYEKVKRALILIIGRSR